MGKHPNSKMTAFAPAMCLVLLLAMTECINSSRVLLDGQPNPGAAPQAGAIQPSEANLGSTNPSAGASSPSAHSSQANAVSPISSPAAANPSSAMTQSAGVTPQPADPATTPATTTPPEIPPAVQQPPVTGGVAGTDLPLTFFMHDVLGASKASAPILGNSNGANAASSSDAVGSTVNTPAVGGAPQNSLPLGTITAIDEQLTEGEEAGSSGVARARGFYVASSHDGTSLTLMLTATFHGGAEGCADTISFFGVYCASVAESNITIVGGTGRYVNAKGYATVGAVRPTGQQNAADDGATLLQFSIYLS